MTGRPKVFIVCSGLGHVNRGYESFARECFDVLKDNPKYDYYLIKGAGPSSAREKTFFNWHRNGVWAQRLAKWTKRDAYFWEELSFFLSFLPYLFFHRPDLIVISDHRTCAMLWQARRFLKFKYRILFSNGAPNGPPFTRCDHVQQLLPCHYRTALEGGTSPTMQSIVPYGIHLHKADWDQLPNKQGVRQSLGLPENCKLLLSVGALNQSHKRMKYLVREFQQLQQEGYCLVILGQPTEETPEVLALAEQLLSKETYSIRSVPSEAVPSYYQAADVFVLCSFSEGLPRVTIEAMSHGLPIVVHDYDITRETLGECATYIDMSVQGALAASIRALKPVDALQVKQKAYETYSWEALKPAYEQMIQTALGPPSR